METQLNDKIFPGECTPLMFVLWSFFVNFFHELLSLDEIRQRSMFAKLVQKSDDTTLRPKGHK